jgi:hypothetical protein
MKNEKLEYLLNKVVEFNQSEHYKGFLYKNSKGYYIKVVESTPGSNISFDDIIYLKEGDEQFITHAEKPKLMRVSMKSWHYRLIKYVLGDNAPTPKNMQNGCPYFWLLIFSLFAISFIMIWKAFVFLLLLFPRLFMWGIEKFAIWWVSEINDEEAYDIYYDRKDKKIPLTARIFFKHDGWLNYNEFIDFFLSEKYDIDNNNNSEEYLKKKEEMRLKWEKLHEERRTKEAERYKQRSILEEKIREKNRERQRKEAIREAKWEARMQPINDALNHLGESIGSIFRAIGNQFKTDPTNWKNIIKRTKQFIGGLITLILLAATYCLINVLACGVMAGIDWFINHWQIIVGVSIVLIIIAAIIGIIYVLYVFLTG